MLTLRDLPSGTRSLYVESQRYHRRDPRDARARRPHSPPGGGGGLGTTWHGHPERQRRQLSAAANGGQDRPLRARRSGVEDELRVDPRDRWRDNEIRGAALQALMSSDPIPGDRIDVAVANGWLTLKGEVKHQDETDAAFDAGLPAAGRRRDHERDQGHHRRRPADRPPARPARARFGTGPVAFVQAAGPAR